jgi:hypothetical protein
MTTSLQYPSDNYGAQFLHESQEQLKAALEDYHTAAYCIIEECPEMNAKALRAWRMADKDEDDALTILAALCHLNVEDV